MGRVSFGLRAAMATVGVATMTVYAAAAYLLYLLAQVVWAHRPDLPTFAAWLVAMTLVSGYLTYRFGTGQALSGLDARELPRERAPGVYAIRDRLAEAMDVSPPVYVARLGEPNALALGGRNPRLVVDASLFRLLDHDELEAVLAHEFAHIEGRDGFVQTLGYSAAQTLIGVVALALAPVGFVAGGFAKGLALLYGRPGQWHRTAPGRLRIWLAQGLTLLLLGLTVAVRTYSRRQEHAADDRAVEVTGKPLALARALTKIDRAASASFPLAPLSPNAGDRSDNPLVRLLSTHPPLDERVERLREKAERAGASNSGTEQGRWTTVPVRSR
ncbi:M48 family metallopeptidase [Halobaculum sp. D14]|uniref:M48 family metallopeptidase n=1 Tax=Halobaculum sp. D14 TaxID=3421642 RepID=UPI003EBCC25A